MVHDIRTHAADASTLQPSFMLWLPARALVLSSFQSCSMQALALPHHLEQAPDVQVIQFYGAVIEDDSLLLICEVLIVSSRPAAICMQYLADM